LIAAVGIYLLLSLLTTTEFCDPLFYRAGWSGLTGHETYNRECSERSEYR